MGKDAISGNKSKEQSPSKDSSSVTASPLIFILAIFAVIVIGLFFFKDKIFRKKTKNLDELVKEKNEEKKEESKSEPKVEPEVIPKDEAEKISDKFAKKN